MWFKVESSDLGFAERARFRFFNESVLNATPDALFELLADAERWPEWFPDFNRAFWVTEPPHGVGSVREAHLKQLKARERFLAWDPGKRWAFTLEEITLPLVARMVEDYRIEPVGEDRCRLSWTVYYQPRLFARPLHFAIRPIFKKMFARATQSLERFLNA